MNESSSPPIQVTPPAGPRGTIVTCTGSLASGRTRAATVWPASCQAVTSRSRSVTTADLRARPITTVARASSKSPVWMTSPLGPGGLEGGLVDQVADVGAGEAGRAAGQGDEVDVVAHLAVLGVQVEEAGAAPAVGRGHGHLAVEPAGPGEGGVEDVGPVGGGDDDDVGVLGEAVHLDEEGVEGRLPLVVGAAAGGGAVAGPADGVDLVEEDDAAGLLGLGEEVADPGGAHADEHLGEVGAGRRSRRARRPHRPRPGPGGSCRCRAGRPGGSPGASGRRRRRSGSGRGGRRRSRTAPRRPRRSRRRR